MSGLITLLIVLAIALYVCWLMLQPFFNVLLWAAVLAVVFYPMHRRILSRNGHPTLSAALSTLLVVVFILLPVTFITIAVVRELSGVATSVARRALERCRSARFRLSAASMDWAGQYIHVDREAAERSWPSAMKRGARSWPAARSWSSAVPSAPSCRWCSSCSRSSTCSVTANASARPRTSCCRIQRVQAHDIALRTQEVIGATVYGVLVIAAIQGTLGTLIFWILGLPSPLLWGVVMFFLSMIPMAGAFLVWVPAALYLALTGAYVKAAILVAWGLLVIGSIDNFLSPRLVGQRARLHELLIFFAVLGGLEVFGVLGLVLGPVVIAVTLALIEMVRPDRSPAVRDAGQSRR